MSLFKKIPGWVLAALFFLALIFVGVYYKSDGDIIQAAIYIAGALLAALMAEFIRPLFARKNKKDHEKNS